MLWIRRDWNKPVGVVRGFQETRVSQVCDGHELVWTLAEIESLDLSHRAAILALQGVRLGQLLLPNMDLEGRHYHVVIGSTWAPYWAPPAIRALKAAYLESVPEQLPNEKVLELLAQRVLGH